MASQPELLQTCFQEAAAAGRTALEHCIDDAVAGLQIAETQSMKMADRDRMATAWRELQKNRPLWAAQYPAALLKAFNVGFSNTARAALLSDGIFLPARPTTGASPYPTDQSLAAAPFLQSSPGALDALRLVDDDDVSQAIESSRLLQLLIPVVEQPLAELDKLISAMQGLPNVRPELNPLRPDVFATSLRELVFAAPAEPAVRSLWLKYLTAPLGRDLKRLYERLVNQLEMASVQGVSYRVLQTQSGGVRETSASGGGDAGSGQVGGEGLRGGANSGGVQLGNSMGPIGYVSDEPITRKPSQYADLSRESISDELFQDFLLRGGASADHGLAPAYYDNIEEELRALKAMPDSTLVAPEEPGEDAEERKETPRAAPSGDWEMPVVDRQSPVHIGSQLSEKVWGVFGRHKERALVRTELKKKAKRVGQVMGLEVVHQLVSLVAQDPRLLAPVREGIVALEPSLLRLAMVDPRFFKDDRHPGRRLMERVAQRSFKYNDERSAEFRMFFQQVEGAFNALNRLTISDAEPFKDALARLENAWDALDETEAAQRNSVLQALRFAEERQAVADQIAFELSNRSDLEDVPGLVMDFLFGPWALAMAQARLRDTRNQIDPQSLGLVVPDLIWSAKRMMTMRQPAKLIEMIPGLLTRLQAGLELLDKDPRESELFFEGLMRIHQPVLKLRRLKSQRDAEESFNAALEPEAMPATPEQRHAKAAAQPWLGRGERAAAGFDDALPGENEDLGGLQEDGGTSVLALPPTDHGDQAKTETQTESESESETGDKNAIRNAVENENAVAENSGVAADAGLPRTLQNVDESDSTPDIDVPGGAEAMVLALRSGAWVDLFYRQRWLRAQLVWASSKGTLFMFVSHGGRAHSMTRRTCKRLIKELLLRPVDSQGVVAQALDAVVNEATAKAKAKPEATTAA